MILYSFIPHWTLGTTLLYTFMGIIGVWAIYKSSLNNSQRPLLKNKYYLIWFFIWTLIAAFRMIDGNAGGTDAIAYYSYFKMCFDIRGWELSPLGLYDSNLGFRWYNRILRLFSDNQFYYLFLTHGIMLACVIKFVDCFKFKKMTYVPFFLIVFWYVRGFCTIRSNLASAILLISLVYLVQNKYKQSIIVAILAVLFHKMMVLYALFIPFYWYAQKKTIKLKYIIVIIIGISMLTTAMLTFVFSGNLLGDEFTDHYSEYSENAMETGFLGNFWKIAFEQIVLGVLMLLLNKQALRYKEDLKNSISKNKFDVIWYACLFDLILIPICSTFGVWRGYEVFYVPRLVMWSLLLGIVSPKDKKWYIIYLIVTCFIFYGWFWQRLSAKSFWYETNLMPYLLNI